MGGQPIFLETLLASEEGKTIILNHKHDAVLTDWIRTAKAFLACERSLFKQGIQTPPFRAEEMLAYTALMYDPQDIRSLYQTVRTVEAAAILALRKRNPGDTRKLSQMELAQGQQNMDYLERCFQQECVLPCSYHELPDNIRGLVYDRWPATRISANFELEVPCLVQQEPEAA